MVDFKRNSRKTILTSVNTLDFKKRFCLGLRQETTSFVLFTPIVNSTCVNYCRLLFFQVYFLFYFCTPECYINFVCEAVKYRKFFLCFKMMLRWNMSDFNEGYITNWLSFSENKDKYQSSRLENCPKFECSSVV